MITSNSKKSILLFIAVVATASAGFAQSETQSTKASQSLGISEEVYQQQKMAMTQGNHHQEQSKAQAELDRVNQLLTTDLTPDALVELQTYKLKLEKALQPETTKSANNTAEMPAQSTARKAKN